MEPTPGSAPATAGSHTVPYYKRTNMLKGHSVSRKGLGNFNKK
jgi:hypothetical protein